MTSGGRALGGRPVATYRVQLTPDNGFAALAGLAPHLARLGVSHAYVSPVLAAAPGSTHGYDVVDHGRVDPRLGGEEGLVAAAAELARHGVGLVVDVVPNHMAIPVPETLNAAMWSFLRDGPDSAYARWFDVVGGGREPIVLPLLARRLADSLDDGELAVDATGGPGGTAVLRYHDHVLPLRPGTEELPLPEVLARQHYRPAFWRSREELNYRRFFEIDRLVGVRVEDAEVFAATHEVLLRLHREGVVQGLRVDHPDGLADPAQYLTRLAEETGDAWVVVEKVLEEGEELPAAWRCAGTTGYDALAMITHVFVEPRGAERLAGTFADVTGAGESWAEAAATGRREVLAGALRPDVDRLASLALAACRADVRRSDVTLRGLTEALLELLAEVPVYRAYVVPGEPPPPESVRMLEGAAQAASSRVPDRAVEVGLLRDLALGRFGRGEAHDEFCVRFQQTTGPAMAKGVEDRACYRWFPLTSLAEVGVRPDGNGLAVHELHEWATKRLRERPDAMTALSTHDTKRSEDVRARLATLSEVPDEWAAALQRWRSTAGELGDPMVEWLLWQTLVGAWPLDAARLSAYLVKAAREAAVHTTWTDPDERYEDMVDAYVRHVLAQEAVVDDVARFVDRIHPGLVASCLGQRALHLFLPGVPDVYQGCEQVSLRLVDPDNRVTPDRGELDALVTRALATPPDPAADLPAAKARLTALGLALLRDHAGLAYAPYVPLRASGEAADHVVAFARGADVAVVVTRFALVLDQAGGWGDTCVDLPAGEWTDVLTHARHHVGDGSTRVADVLGWPVALLVRAAG